MLIQFSKKQKILTICIATGLIIIAILMSFFSKQHMPDEQKIYISIEKGYQFTYNASHVILQENGYGVTVSAADSKGKIVNLQISNNPLSVINYTAYPDCTTPDVKINPCIYNNKVFPGPRSTTFGNFAAKQFYITFGEKDPDNELIIYTIIQTDTSPSIVVKARILHTTLNPYFSNSIKTFTFLHKPTEQKSTITYHSKTGNYSIEVPASWYVVSREMPPGSMTFDPENEIGIHRNGLTMQLYQPSKNDTIWQDRYPDDITTNRSITSTKIAGYKALVKFQIHKYPPVKISALNWYNGPDKDVILYLSDTKAIRIQAKWDQYKPQYEAAMDAIIGSIRIDQ